jgi:nitroreductase
MLKEASHAVIVCGDTSLAKYPDFWVQDCAAATENLLLAAQDLGIGSVWLGVYSNPPVFEGIRKFLGLAENILPFSIVSLGFPAERKETADRYDDDRVHWNKW